MMTDLLLLLSKYPPDEKTRPTLSRLIEQVQDWPLVTNLINSHGIIALAAYNIKEAGLEREIPPRVMATLENGYLQAVVRNAWLTERWKEVNKILGDAGIKHIVLKGMALEHTVYDSKGLRQMNDNDILLRMEDCMKAWYLLQKEGFIPETIKSGLHKKILLDIGKHLPELHKDGYSLEIHHHLSDDICLEGEGSVDPFADAIEISIENEKAWTLSKNLHLKYLISHFEKHKQEGNCQIRLLTDIKLLDEVNPLTIPDHFIKNPKQEMRREYRKGTWEKTIQEVPSKYRFRFILGDVFPSLKWMKERYKCNVLRAILYYPARIAKLTWLI